MAAPMPRDAPVTMATGDSVFMTGPLEKTPPGRPGRTTLCAVAANKSPARRAARRAAGPSAAGGAIAAPPAAPYHRYEVVNVTTRPSPYEHEPHSEHWLKYSLSARLVALSATR